MSENLSDTIEKFTGITFIVLSLPESSTKKMFYRHAHVDWC